MTNEERFKSAIERRAEYIKYRGFCKKQKLFVVDEFDWLALQHKEELKPCPFCGEEAGIIKVAQGHFEYSVVECKKCLCRTVGLSSEAEAISKWNRRVK